jgi:hypothetical protein
LRCLFGNSYTVLSSRLTLKTYPACAFANAVLQRYHSVLSNDKALAKNCNFLSTESMVVCAYKAHCGNGHRHELAPYLRGWVDYKGPPRRLPIFLQSRDHNRRPGARPTRAHQTVRLNTTLMMTMTTRSISCNPPLVMCSRKRTSTIR